MAKICIGIPAFQGIMLESQQDYMRFLYYIGRRMPEHDFFLGIKTKSEQFRARNTLAQNALALGCDYLLFLDDDHVIDWRNAPGPTDCYGFLRKLVAHMEADPKLGIVGALYYKRDGDCSPVLMRETSNGAAYRFLRDDEIAGELQPVDVAGGGAMLVRCEMLLKVPDPFFEPELTYGTDVQICRKAKEAGYTVAADTSIVLGHVKVERSVITPENRHLVFSQACADVGTAQKWADDSALRLYRMDAEEYLGMPFDAMVELGFVGYDRKNFSRFKDYKHPADYYRSLGPEQLARQVAFHSRPDIAQQMAAVVQIIDANVGTTGLDYGCGSAPVGFELAMRGHRVDFIDLDGTPAYEFLKWRVKKRAVKCGWKVAGPYDWVLMLDSLEHLPNWKTHLGTVCDALKEHGALITNYFLNKDEKNPEHVSMDKKAVMDWLTKKGLYPVNHMVWVKQTDLKKAAA